MRPAPLVITTKLITTKMMKMVIPMTVSPPMRNSPKAVMTAPAGWPPSWPCPRISRVEAMLSPSRNMVAISRIVGNAASSNGFSMNSAVIRIITDRVIEKARPISSSQPGSGRISMAMIVMTPPASARSRLRPKRDATPSSRPIIPVGFTMVPS